MSDDAYYTSSDEDVSWGPITMREAKRNIRKNFGSTKLTRRATVGFNTPPSTKKPEADVQIEDIKEIIEDVSAISLNSKYFTPHETLSSMLSGNNSVESGSHYNTVDLDNKILHCDSDPKRSTLSVENHDDKVFNESYQSINIKVERVDLTSEVVEVIEISDEEESFEEIVKEITNNIDNDSFSFQKDSIDYINNVKENAHNTSEVEGYYQPEEPYEEMIRYQGVQSKYENISGVYNLDDSSLSKNDMSEVYPEESVSSTSGNVRFNDTLEEIENLLANGLNYSMKTEDRNSDLPQARPLSPILPEETNTNKFKSRIPLRPQSNKKMYENVISPVANYIKTSPSPFKVPLKPKKLISPAVLNKHKPNFKDITSPVGIYIKNSSTAPLIKKLHDTPLPKPLAITTNCPKNVKAKENLKLPTAIYKPSKEKETNNIHDNRNLPNSIKNLMTTKLHTIKHEKKIMKPLDLEDKNKRLIDGNLTVNCSVNNDISILKCKENLM